MLDSTGTTIATRLSHNEEKAQFKWSKDDFEIIQQLGRGKFGMVYLAREKSSRYIVAIKRMDRIELEKNSFHEQVKR
jgi:serine/threonine protein kinase